MTVTQGGAVRGGGIRDAAIHRVTDPIVLAVAPETCPEAIDAAFTLAAERRTRLLAVRVWHDPDLALGGWLRPEHTAAWDAAHRKARRDLDRALKRARAAHPEVEVSTVVVDDDPVPFLAAFSTRAELLVLGRSRRLGHHSSPSSPVDALVHQAACPVLVVPPGAATVEPADGYPHQLRWPTER